MWALRCPRPPLLSAGRRVPLWRPRARETGALRIAEVGNPTDRRRVRPQLWPVVLDLRGAFGVGDRPVGLVVHHDQATAVSTSEVDVSLDVALRRGDDVDLPPVAPDAPASTTIGAVRRVPHACGDLGASVGISCSSHADLGECRISLVGRRREGHQLEHPMDRGADGGARARRPSTAASAVAPPPGVSAGSICGGVLPRSRWDVARTRPRARWRWSRLATSRRRAAPARSGIVAVAPVAHLGAGGPRGHDSAAAVPARRSRAATRPGAATAVGRASRSRTSIGL